MCKLEVQFIHGIYFGYRQSLRECADCTSSRAQYMPPADIAYPGLIPASSKRDFYSLAVVLFELLCGPDNHPYLTRQQRQRCHSVNHNTDVRLRMASWIMDAPGVIIWGHVDKGRQAARLACPNRSDRVHAQEGQREGRDDRGGCRFLGFMSNCQSRAIFNGCQSIESS